LQQPNRPAVFVTAEFLRPPLAGASRCDQWYEPASKEPAFPILGRGCAKRYARSRFRDRRFL